VAERNERGVALLVVLLTVALLTISVMEFTFSSQVDYRRAVHWIQARQARLVADSGIAVASEILSRSEYLYLFQFLDRAQILETDIDDIKKVADGLPELWAQLCEAVERNECPQKNQAATCRSPAFGGDDSIFEADEASLAVQIDDEAGRYNLNRLFNSTATEKERFRRLLASLKIDTEIADAVDIWTDKRSRGMTFSHDEESSFSDEREIRYRGRGGPLKSYRELALVENVSPRELAMLRPYATVSPETDSTVNFNTAPLEVLAAMHRDLADQALLARIHQARCVKPFESLDEVRNVWEEITKGQFEAVFTLKSERFRIRATGAVGDAVQSVEAVVRREYPAEGVRRAQWEIELLYYLPRRGPNLLGVDMTENASLNELRLSVPSSDGGFL
jgi:type II secretory pathway component PulK